MRDVVGEWLFVRLTVEAITLPRGATGAELASLGARSPSRLAPTTGLRQALLPASRHEETLGPVRAVDIRSLAVNVRSALRDQWASVRGAA